MSNMDQRAQQVSPTISKISNSTHLQRAKSAVTPSACSSTHPKQLKISKSMTPSGGLMQSGAQRVVTVERRTPRSRALQSVTPNRSNSKPRQRDTMFSSATKLSRLRTPARRVVRCTPKAETEPTAAIVTPSDVADFNISLRSVTKTPKSDVKAYVTMVAPDDDEIEVDVCIDDQSKKKLKF